MKKWFLAHEGSIVEFYWCFLMLCLGSMIGIIYDAGWYQLHWPDWTALIFFAVLIIFALFYARRPSTGVSSGSDADDPSPASKVAGTVLRCPICEYPDFMDTMPCPNCGFEILHKS
jgi:hypothetical protein